MDAEKPTSVAICALASNSIPSASVLGEHDELWTINNGHAIYDLKPDMIIAMDDLERDEDAHPTYVGSIVEAGVPVLSTGPKEKWPSVEAFPVQEVCDFLKPFYPEPWRILDNTCNYAFALALTRGYEEIGVFGFDWCVPYEDADLECSLVRFMHDGYGDVPEWFKYYHPSIMTPRRPREPGIESFHFLLGLAMGLNRVVSFSNKTTILNKDRDKFYYGYQTEDMPK